MTLPRRPVQFIAALALYCAAALALAGAPLAPVSVDGADLRRDGEIFRVFGVQNLEHPFERAFYREGTALQRAAMQRRIDALEALGVNTLRAHLQLFDFVGMAPSGELFARERAFDNLSYLVSLAQEAGIYLLLSANNVWTTDVLPAWYDDMHYRERWEVQAFFLGQLALRLAPSPAILAYELMSEPVVRLEADAPWYSGQIEDYRFVQAVARGVPEDQANAVGREWVLRLRAAVREHDPQGLVTFGAMGGFYGGPLGVDNVGPLLDLVSPHIYPDVEDPGYALRIVHRYLAAGKPLVIGETHSFQSSPALFAEFLREAAPLVDGIISFYHGSGDAAAPIGRSRSALILDWHAQNLQVLREMRAYILQPPAP